MGVDDLARVLRDEVAELVKGAVLNIIEFGAQGIVAWEVRRDRNGTPHAWYWSHAPISSATDDSLGNDAKLREFMDSTGRLLCVINSVDGSDASLLKAFEDNRPDMRTFHASAPVDASLRWAITHAPLTHRYELVVLRRDASGHSMMDGYELFPESTVCPKQTMLRIRCDPGEGQGTVFAVVATEGARSFRLVSAQTADVDSGVYDLTAELVRPGTVRFHGLPSTLRAEHRSWSDLVAEIPRKLAEVRPTHLICAIEVSGSTEQVADRVHRVRQLIRQADEAAGLRVSLITYGAHSFDRKVPDEPATVLRWGGTSRAALSVLDGLETLSPVSQTYPKAAQLECVLALLIERLGTENPRSRPDRPVLVTIGVRPAFPPRVDPRTTILPCPARHDWRRDRRLLARAYPDIAFGAIYDDAAYPQGAAGEVWRELGATALVSGKYVDSREFAADLKLRMSADGLPFPLAETGGG